MMLLTAIMVLQKSGVRCILYRTLRYSNLLGRTGVLRALCILTDYEL